MKTLKKLGFVAAALAILLAVGCSNTAGGGEEPAYTDPMLKGNNSFRKALKDAGATTGDSSNVQKIVFGLLSDQAVKTAIEEEAVAAIRKDIGEERDTYYAYYNATNKTLYIVPASEKTQKFVLNPNSAGLFSDFTKCTAIEGLELLDTSKVTNMNYMFYECRALTSLDLSGKFDTSNVTNMSSMFYGCGALTSLDLSGFDTSNVTDMNHMFRSCKKLTSLDVSGFDTSNVTDMNHMFEGCNALTSLDLSGFDTSKVTNMRCMFYSCYATLTSLDLSSFDTSKVTDMSYMFWSCKKLTSLDLSSFDTSKVKDMYRTFNGCTNLETIYIKDKNTFVPEAVKATDAVEESSNNYMFKDCKAQEFTNIADKQ